MRRFAQLGTDAEKSAAGVRSLDDSLVGAAGAADKASTSNTRYSQSTTRAAAAEEKAAAAARLRSDAESRLGVVLTRIAGEDTRVQQATLRQATAQERANIAAGEGNAVFARQASAQASLIGANRALARSQEATTAATGRMSSGFVGALKTAGELGLLIGGIEIAKKAIEFVGAGRDLTTSLNSVQAAAQATDQQMIAVRAQAIGLGKDLTVPRATAVDAAKAIDDLVRSGMTLPRAMAAARSALLLASVSQTDMTLTSRVLGDALDEFRLPATQAAHVASLLGAAATSTAGGLDTVFQALKYSGTRARAAKVPMQDLLASIVDLSKAGLQGTTIGTGLAMMITRLASKSAPTVAALKDLGISAWDAQGRFKGLPFVIQAISDSYKRFGPNSKRFLSDLNSAFGARAANIMAAFAGKGVAGIDRFENRLKGFDLQTAANNMNRGFSAAMGQISKQLTALGIDIYQNLEPALAGAAMWLGTSIPHALGVLAHALAPTAHLVGAVLGGAFHGLIAVLGPVAGALGATFRFLADHGVIADTANAVLLLWGAFKGYTIAVAAFKAIQTGAVLARVRLLELRESSALGAGALGAVALAGYAAGKGINSFVERGNAMAHTLGSLSQDAQSWRASLDAANGALDRSTKLQVAAALQSNGLAEKAAKAGISLGDLTRAVTGNDAQMNALIETWKRSGAPSGDTIVALGLMHGEFRKTAADAKAAAEAVDGHAGAAKRDTAATNASAAATRYDTTATMQLKQQTDLLKGALGGIARQLNNAAAAVAWQQSLNDLTATFKQNKGAIEGHSTAALADKSALIGDMQTVVQHAQAMQKNGASVQSVTGYITRQYGELRQHAVAAGADGKQIDALAKKLGVFPRSIKSKLTIDPTEALNAVAQVRVAVTNLPSGNFSLRSNGSLVRGSLAAGGVVHGPGTGTSDTAGVYALSNGEAVIPAKAVSRHPEVIHRLIREGRGRAGGGIMGYVTGAGFRGQSAQTAAAIAMAESGGNAYAHNGVPPDNSYGLFQINMIGGLGPARRAQYHLASNSALYNPAVNARVAYAMSGGGRNFSPWTTYTSGAYRQFLGQDGAVSNAGGATPGSGGTGTSSAQAAAQAARQLARQQVTAGRHAVNAGNKLGNMVGRNLHVDSHGNLHGQTESASAIRDQLGALGKDIRDAGASKAFIHRIGDESDAILAAARKRNQAAAQLEKAHAVLAKARAKERQDFGSFRSARMGGFDITSAGTDPVTGKVTRGSILAQQGQYISRLKEMNRDLRHLAPLIPASYLRRLEGEDPETALPELRALMSMNPAQDRMLRRQAATISQLSTSGAKFGATHLDQHAINVARKNEREAAKRERQDQHQLMERLDKLDHTLSHLTVAGKADFNFKDGTLVYALKADEHHVATHRRGRPKASG